MVEVLEVLMPVAVMLTVGVFCKKFHFLDRQSVDGLKFLTTKVILPAAVFHALATAAYNSMSFLIIGIMTIMLVISFGAGYLMRPFLKEPYKKYLPFMVSVYEGGMMGYPLYTNLCGAENLSNIALLDIAGLLFGFSVYMSMLNQTENGERLDVRQICRDALRNPSFVAAVLGLSAGLSEVVLKLQESAAGPVYDAIADMITAPLSAVILVVVGFEIEPVKRLIKPCLQTIFLRVCLQAVMVVGVICTVHCMIGRNQMMDAAIISYMSTPATFSMQSFIKNEEGSEYVSTTNSLYCFVTIFVYAVMAVIIF